MTAVPLPRNYSKILDTLHITSPEIIGKGGEGIIVEYKGKALKIYYKATESYLQQLQNLQKTIASHGLSFVVPQILEIGNVEETFYTIENKLVGVQMDKMIPALSPKDRQTLFRSYYDAIKQIHSITLPDRSYGQLIDTPERITSATWTDFLIQKLRQKVDKTKTRHANTVTDYEQKALLLETIIKDNIHTEEKRLVHSDYYLNNVLATNDLSISAVLDFSVHAVVGDPRLDISGVLSWNAMDKNIQPDDYSFLYEIARNDYGDDLDMYVDIYNLYSSFYYSDMSDASFSINNLNDDSIWKRIGQG